MKNTPIIIDHIGLLKTTQDFKNEHIFDEINELNKELRKKYGTISKLIKRNKK
ncbi:replicative DNA helicase [Kolpuevirus frurule]|uniref:Replicative DNA helicase n=1 Tax=Kolpuevirus sp. 'frurule' TaxID=3028514 RepID=A0AAF0DPB3_9CAUD|nr:replicative DNA helicase [Kolpuevirus sp. 'frurule']